MFSLPCSVYHVQFNVFSCHVPPRKTGGCNYKKNAFSRNFSKYNCKTLDILVQISNIYQSKAYKHTPLGTPHNYRDSHFVIVVDVQVQ